jgi:hypothetical protein
MSRPGAAELDALLERRDPTEAVASAASRPELLHRDHVLHELIDGDLGALVKAR